jgi:2-desacetyl-2-hydroxyethyl bacteriochlorophyllide A dehydrogenase
MVPGYQKVGVIEWVGDAARHRKPDLREGQMVFATMTRCEGMRFPSGGHVERGPVPVSEVFRLPETAYPEAFAGAVLTQVGYNAGSRPPLEPGDPFLVIGDGLVGHWSAQTLRLRGARVAMLGRHQYRLDRFETGEHGLRLWAGAEDWRERLKEWAGGELAGLVDTVGNHTNMDQNLTLIGLIRRCGQYVTVGHHGPKPLDLCPFIRRELTLHCPAGWSSARLGATLQLIAAEELSTLSLVTHRFPASAVAEAWSLIEAKKDETLGVLLEW